ncbi:MAG: malto-oligosyltrehalose trehalohydrolase [Acidobacteria bacterium]|nr:malto-oligosyltrehalose trehalohydrolase [Acidobacteriota bacterium]
MSVTSSWTPWLGAVPDRDGVRFRTWAAAAEQVEVLIERWRSVGPAQVLQTRRLDVESRGVFSGRVEGARAGDLYRYRLDGRDAMPDPASRFQPLGVHGPSEIVDPDRFDWRDDSWRGLRDRTLAKAVFYELHVGTFTPAGTFAGVEGRLPYLRDLGVTAIELMPIADFSGARNWGYDGVALFAPARVYGRPDDLRRLVDAAHRLGLAIVLDVVYNHFGPDGACAVAFSPKILSSRHQNPWGAGINFDGPDSALARRMLIDNALHWLHEYHVDGFRLDATHAMVDDSATHFVAELTACVHAARPDVPPVVVAEDSRNLGHMLRDPSAGGWGLEGAWADDLHHVVHVTVTRESDGYYQDYAGTAREIARTLEHGWLYTGQRSTFWDTARGTDPSGIPLSRFVVSLQTHDQVGNRACGERLHHLIDAASWRAASVLLLLAPETPLLFMGQEWAASTPFLYFTDHNPALGEQVTRGRRQEFTRFARFADPSAIDRIPDPQSPATFDASRLRWEEIDREPHDRVLRFYRRLLALRRETGVVPGFSRAFVEVLDDRQIVIALRRGGLAAIVCLRGPAEGGEGRSIALPAWAAGTTSIDSEDPQLCLDPCPIVRTHTPPAICFQRAGAIVIRTGSGLLPLRSGPAAAFGRPETARAAGPKPED